MCSTSTIRGTTSLISADVPLSIKQTNKQSVTAQPPALLLVCIHCGGCAKYFSNYCVLLQDKIKQVFDNLIELEHPNIAKFHKYWMDTIKEKPRVSHSLCYCILLSVRLIGLL